MGLRKSSFRQSELLRLTVDQDAHAIIADFTAFHSKIDAVDLDLAFFASLKGLIIDNSQTVVSCSGNPIQL